MHFQHGIGHYIIRRNRARHSDEQAGYPANKNAQNGKAEDDENHQDSDGLMAFIEGPTRIARRRAVNGRPK